MQPLPIHLPVVDFASALFLYGPLGVMCAWLMWTNNKQGRSIDTLSRAILLDLVTRDNIGPKTKMTAERMLEKLARSDTFNPDDL